MTNNNGFSRPAQQSRKIFAQHHAALFVERREGFIHQKNVGAGRNAARKIDPLAHADRKLLRIDVRQNPACRPN